MIVKNITVWLMSMFLSVLTVHACGSELKFAAYKIPGLFEKDRTGTYDKIISHLSKILDKPIIYEVLPPGQLEYQFQRKKLDCVIPLDRRFWHMNGNFINSEPLNIAKVYIFSRIGEGPYTRIDQIKDKKIGARIGIPYGPKADNLKLELAQTDDQNVQMLNAKRIDVFLAYFPDMLLWKNTHTLSLPNHSITPLDIHNDAFLCKDTPETRKFLTSFNAAVVKIRQSGELKQMLGNVFVP